MKVERFNKILVVDDSSANLKLLLNLLTEKGYTVHPASSGELALAFVQSTLPDLILLDIKMPGIDGYEVCRRLKADQRIASIPIIFLSALEDERDKVKGFQAGGVDYITKPFQAEEMLARIRIHLRMRELTEGLEQEVGARTEELLVANKRLEEEIAERRQAEVAQRISSERLQLATQVANIGIWDWNVVNNELLWDDSMYRLYGIREEDFGGAYDAWARTIHAEDRAHAEGEIQAALRGEREYATEFRIVWPDGSIRHIKADSKTFKDQDGKPLRMIGTNIDITELLRAEEALRKLNSDFVTLLESTSDFIYFKDRDNRFLFCSQTLANITGHQSWRDMIGKDDFDVFPEETARIYREEEQSILSQGKALLNKVDPYFDARGGRGWVNTNKWPVFDESKAVVGIFGISRDITEQRQAEEELVHYKEHLEETVRQRTEELRLARDAADSANKAKSVFLANMSHELRTPLNAILGFSQLMRQDPSLSASQRHSLEIINNSGDHLLKLINDVLEIAKIEAGKLQLQIAVFDLHELVREVSDMMSLRADQKGLRLELDQASDFPRYIKGDEARLRQILVNLVSNAVKFTEKGRVTLRLGVMETAPHNLLIEVKDSGRGISETDQQCLFKPFEQLPTGEAEGGTGLGLAIVRQFVQLMGGEIAVVSRPGKGSLFHVELPLEEAEGGEVIHRGARIHGEITGLEPGQPNYRILIAEDQHDNQILLSKLMSNLGLEVRLAENGEACVALFKQWRPHLIWMDWRMPLMDGEEAARQIRNLPQGEMVKIVAVTAAALKEEEAELQKVGMDDYIRKPYHLSDIYDCLARHLGLRYTFREKAAEPASAHGVLPLQRLAVLPAVQLTELRDAVISLDQQRIYHSIRSIATVDAELGRTLSHLADNFDYPSMLQALKRVARE